MAGIVAAILASPMALAASLSWDPAGAGGGSGTWDTTTASWNDGSTAVTWNNAAGDTAIFGGTAGTVTLSEAITAGGLDLTTDGYTLTGNTLTISGGGAIAVGSGLAATVSSTLSATSGLVKTGAGSATVSGPSTITGNVTVNGGTLGFANTVRDVARMEAASGATLSLATTNMFVDNHDTPVPSTLVLAADGGTILMTAAMESRIGSVSLANGATWTNNRPSITGYDILLGNTSAGAATVSVTGSGAAAMNTTNNGILHIQGTQNFVVEDTTGDTAADLVVSMELAGPDNTGGAAGGINKTGAGTMVLAANNNYLSGPIVVAEGVLQVDHSFNVSSLPESLSIGTGATAILDGVNLFNLSHETPVPDSLVITVDGGTMLMGAPGGSRVGNVVLSNAAVWTSNRGLAGYDNLLADTSAGPATVTVNGTGAALMNGSGGLHLQGVQTFDVADTTGDADADLTVSMVLDDPGFTGGAAGGLAKAGAGRMVLAASNSFTGDVAVSAGTLEVSGQLGGGSYAGAITNATALVFSSAADQTLTGGISGTGTLAKSGGGNLTLDAPQTYTGSTSVTGGRLSVNDTLASPTVIVSGGTLGGVGTLAGTVDVQTGGRLAPGNSIGVLTEAATTFASGATFDYEVDSRQLGNLGEAADLLVVNGNLEITSGAVLSVTDLATSPAAFVNDTTVFAMINYTGSWNGGLFTYDGQPLADGSRFTVGSQEWQIDYAYQYDTNSPTTLQPLNYPASHVPGTGQQTFVAVTAVPEPAVACLVVAGLASLPLVMRRRARPRS